MQISETTEYLDENADPLKFGKFGVEKDLSMCDTKGRELQGNHWQLKPQNPN